MLAITKKVREETVALAQELVRIRSTNPPGNEEGIASYVRDHLVKAGIDAALIPLEPGRSSVLARIPGREPGSLILCGHLDTVDAGEEGWSVPPFEGRVENGKLYGRGAADMKGGVAVLVEIAKLAAAHRMRPKKDIVLLLTADEEGTYRGAASTVEAGLIEDAEFLLVAEPTGGAAYLGEKGELWVEAIFLGQAAHGSVPDRGRNSVLPACEFTLLLSEAAGGFADVPGLGRTSLNVGQFQGGWRVNVVPDRAQVKLDFRVVSDEDHVRALDLVDRLGGEVAARRGVEFSSRVASYHPPITSDPADPYVRGFLAATGAAPERAGLAPFCTDAVAIVPQLGISLMIYGPGSIDQAHRPDEHLELSSLYAALESLARFLDPERESS